MNPKLESKAEGKTEFYKFKGEDKVTKGDYPQDIGEFDSQKWNYEKTIVAKAFCQRGFGVLRVREQVQDFGIQFKDDKTRYKPVAIAVVTDTCRKLQNFLQEVCREHLSPLSAQEMRAIHTLLLNSRTCLNDEDYQTFIKFIRLTFDLGSVSVTEKAAAKLYVRIQQCLQGRVAASKLDSHEDRVLQQKSVRRELLKTPGRYMHDRLDSHKIWTREMELQIIKDYLRLSVIGKVRDNFRVKYGAAIHPYYDDAKILKSRFYKIIRLMVRRLQFLTNQVGGKYKPKTVNKDVPELVPLNDVKTKALLRSPYALDIRKKLAELYMDDQMNLEKASAIIKDLNAFFLDKNNGVFSNLKEKPLITNTLQRVKHNVKSMHRMLNQSTPRPAYEQGEIILKEDNGAYQHIVNSQNGNNLHYFRKVNSKVRQRFDAIVRQEGLAREGNGKPEEEFPEIDEQKPNQGDHQNDPDYDQEDIPEFCVSDSDGEMEDIP